MPARLKIKVAGALLLVLAFAIVTVQRSTFLTNPKVEYAETMGTFYNVKIIGKVSRKDFKKLTSQIEEALADVNSQMSTWLLDSEISQFNKQETTEPYAVSPAFATVVREALALSESTNGAFDPTLNPLLNLWGFGSEGENYEKPGEADVIATKKLTGWQNLQLNKSGQLVKTIPELELDLSAIAKGYGSDMVADVIRSAGFSDFFVEIGGEVVASGHNADGVPWKIGIQMPSGNPLDNSVYEVLHIKNGAIATSGDYRNYIEQDGVVYSHILDPRTGRPALSDVASVTVFAPNCMLADGAATALFVVGEDAGLAWVEQNPAIEALFLVRGAEGKIIEKFSSGFCSATGYSPASRNL